MTQLYARNPLVQGLVPRLVGLAHERHRVVPQDYPGEAPVVLLTGGHGMGKTAVLDALADAYEGRLPLGRADFAALGADGAAPGAGPVRFGGLPVTGASNTSDVVETLELLVEGLAPPVPGYGRRRFRRLLPGLFAVTSWHKGNAAEQALAQARITRLLAACGMEADDEGETSTGVRWVADVGAQLAYADQNPDQDLQPVAAAVVRQFFDRHVRRREARVARGWYEERATGATEESEALVRLSFRFHRGGDFRQAVERTLVEAFLADLSDAYGSWQQFARRPRPLVLLDNAHTEAGRAMLGLLLAHRAESGGSHPDPLVVVAAQLDSATGRYPYAVRRELPEVATAAAWSRADTASPSSPSAGVLTTPLPPLGQAEVLEMLDAAYPAHPVQPAQGTHGAHTLHPQLPTALHRLSRGQPLAAQLLCEGVRQMVGERSVEPELLLDLSTPEGRPVTELLVERLIGTAQMRDHLVLLSLARDRAAADALAEAYAVSTTQFPAAEAERYLREEQWAAPVDGPDAGPDAGPGGQPDFVADPLLRTLLVAELRRTSTAPTGTRPWRALNRLLREHHAARGDAGEPDVLRHTLAAGDAEPVVDRLTECFWSWEAARWLGCLRRVVSAPHPPGAEWADRRWEIARGDDDRRHPDADEDHRTVNRLLHGLWYLADPVAEPTADRCDGVRTQLGFLAMRHPSGFAVLHEASTEWPSALWEHRPLPMPRPHRTP
ncbi:ATP-binding protein [Streptomyces sp. N2-109]|uniref:ATP-binding protein n=1 Tax=Streptomyces gossypii TaxID=2883101 RepID=A0ABT2JW15_9ACTN|nr:ATP-binding protein [Streptomyces gossypii]MCT2592097.1 ATP-binding protein [Streptomyces gossypii]